MEALVLPVRMGDNEHCVIRIVSHVSEVHFDAEDVHIMTALADFTSSALRLLRAQDPQSQGPLKPEEETASDEKTVPFPRSTRAEMETEILARTAQLQRLLASETTRQDE